MQLSLIRHGGALQVHVTGSIDAVTGDDGKEPFVGILNQASSLVSSCRAQECATVLLVKYQDNSPLVAIYARGRLYSHPKAFGEQ